MNLELSYTTEMFARMLFPLMSAGWLLTKVTAILGAAFLAVYLMERSANRFSAAARHHVWSVALGSVLVLTLLTAIVPPLGVRIKTNALVASILQRLPSQQSTTPLNPYLRMSSPTKPGAIPPSPMDLNQYPTRRFAAINVDRGAAAQPLANLSYRFVMNGIRVILTLWPIWLVGVIFLLARLANSHRKLSSLVRRARDVNDPAVLDCAQQMANRLQLPRQPRVLLHESVVTPCMAGWFRPVVLLPESSCDWTHNRLYSVLSHEFAHVSRNDYLTQLMVSVVCALYWFHPAVWIAARKLRDECERAADDCAIARIPSVQYAQHLLALADRTSSHSSTRAVALGMAQSSQLERRIRAMLNTGISRATISRETRRLTSVGALLVLVPVSALRTGGGVESVWSRPQSTELLGDGLFGSRALPDPTRHTTATAAASDSVFDRTIMVYPTDAFILNVEPAAELIFHPSNANTIRVRTKLPRDVLNDTNFVFKSQSRVTEFRVAPGTASRIGMKKLQFEIWMPVNTPLYVQPTNSRTPYQFKVAIPENLVVYEPVAAGSEKPSGIKTVEIEGAINSACANAVVAQIVGGLHGTLSCGPHTFPATRFQPVRVRVNGKLRTDTVQTQMRPMR